MSAAVTRTRKFKQGSNELGQGAESGSGELEATPVIDIAKPAGTQLGPTGEHGMTPLMRAACEGLAGTVQAMLDRGAEVNAKRSDGFNALALAAFFGHSQVVWLLLENGADLSAIGRFQTPPEMWADVKGFLDVGDLIRDARGTKQAVAQNLRTEITDEPARFPRPAEKEQVQPDGDPIAIPRDTIDETEDLLTPLPVEAAVEAESGTSSVQPSDNPGPVSGVAVIEEASQPSSPSRPEVLAEESPARISESPKVSVPHESDPQNPQQPATNQPLPAVKFLPEIEDPPPLVVPEFHPGSVFVSRITSSRNSLILLVLVLGLVGGGLASLLVPQVRKSLVDGRGDAVPKTATLPTEPGNPVSRSATNASGTVETAPAATTDSTAPSASNGTHAAAGDTAETPRLESTSQVESPDVSGKSSTNVNAPTGSQTGANSTSSIYPDSSAETFGIDRQFSSPASPSRYAGTPRKQRSRSRPLVKQETVLVEQPKPAPLSVEAGKTRSVVSTPVRSANEEPISQPPASVISNKPKSKVIQWP